MLPGKWGFLAVLPLRWEYRAPGTSAEYAYFVVVVVVLVVFLNIYINIYVGICPYACVRVSNPLGLEL